MPPVNTSDSASYCWAPWGMEGNRERPSLDTGQGLGFLGLKNAFPAGRHGAARSQVRVKLRKPLNQSFRTSEIFPPGPQREAKLPHIFFPDTS